MKPQMNLKFLVWAASTMVTVEFIAILLSGKINPFSFSRTLILFSVALLYFIEKAGFYSKKIGFVVMITCFFIVMSVMIVALNSKEGRSSSNPYETESLRL